MTMSTVGGKTKQLKQQNLNNWIPEKKYLPPDVGRNKDKAGLFGEFAQNATVHGLNRAYGTDRSRFRRCFWLFAFLGMIIGVFYTVITQLVVLTTYPTISKQSMDFRGTMPFPAVTLCNLNQIRRSMSHDEARRQLLLAMSDMGKVSTTTMNMSDPIWANHSEMNTEQMRSYIEEISHPLNLTLMTCEWNNTPFQCDELFTDRLTDFGHCYIFNAREDAKSVQRIAMHQGSKYGLTIVANVMQEDYVMSANSDAAGLRVVLHDFNETPLVEGRGFDVAPGFATKCSLKMKRVISLPPPYRSIYGHECTNTSPEHFSNFLKLYERYDLGACVSECRYNYIVKKCNCQGGFDMGNATMCSTSKIMGCYIPRFEEFMTKNLHLECACPMPCGMTMYDATISIASYPSKPLMEQLKDLHNISLDEDTFRRNYVKLTLAYDNFVVEIIEQMPQYTFESIMSALGGQLGFFLGASLLSLLEFMEFGLNILIFKVFGAGNKTKPNE